MMLINKHVVYAILTFVGILVVGGAALVWPALNKRSSVIEAVADLNRRSAGLSSTTSEVEALARQVQAMGDRVRDDFKQIPDQANLADVMRTLSLPVDGQSVADQTFTAGTPGDALTDAAGGAMHLRIMPLTIDMQATFESVYAVLEATESMPRLIRVSSLHMNFKRDPKTEHVQRPLIEASLGLEAVFASASPEPAES